MNKPFEIEFKIDAIKLAILFMCWKFKFPVSYFLTFYQMYGKQVLFIFKAIACTKRITLNDSAFTNIIEESKKLQHQILKGISTKIQIAKLEALVKNGRLIDEDIPEQPKLDLSEFSEEYKKFIQTYLLKNIVNIFSDTVVLKVGTKELYNQIANDLNSNSNGSSNTNTNSSNNNSNNNNSAAKTLI